MRALDLNLASRPFKNNTLLWIAYLVAFILLGLFTTWNIVAWREHIEKLTDLQDTVQSIEGRIADLDLREERAKAGIRSFDLAALEIQAAKANEVIEWKAFSWTRLFNEMERVQPYNVRMTSIRPLFRGGEKRSVLKALEGDARQSMAIAVEGTAKTFSAFWEMQNALLSDDHFGQVDPERLNKTETREILFQLSFLYYPEGNGQAEADAAPAESDDSEQPAEQPAEEPIEEQAAPPAEEPQADAAKPSPQQPATEEIAPETEQEPEEAPRTRFTKAKRSKTKGRRR
jgi:hypothetical protein